MPQGAESTPEGQEGSGLPESEDPGKGPCPQGSGSLLRSLGVALWMRLNSSRSGRPPGSGPTGRSWGGTGGQAREGAPGTKRVERWQEEGLGFLPAKEWGFSQDPWPRAWGGGWHEEAGGWSRRASTGPLGWWCPGLTVGLRHLAPFSCASTCPHTAGSRLDREQLPNLAPVYGRGHQREPPRVAPVQGTMAVSGQWWSVWAAFLLLSHNSWGCVPGTAMS